MDNRTALTARLRELEAEAHAERGNRDAELERVKWLEGEVSDSRLKAAQHGDALRDAEYDADLIRRALQVSPNSELDAVWSALRSNRITAPDSSLPPSDADPATGIPYGELT